ncbi:MAG: ArsI/CadI family heavy metal resistance metalloenzyme [Gammaproteobacteria bacterium]
MKRFHVHVHVTDLQENVRFYSGLFGAEPSARERGTGIGHLGLQVDTDAELAQLGERARPASKHAHEERAARCCYARSNKLWLKDPQGVLWETFRTFDRVEEYGDDVARAAAEKACGCAA